MSHISGKLRALGWSSLTGSQFKKKLRFEKDGGSSSRRRHVFHFILSSRFTVKKQWVCVILCNCKLYVC